MSKRKNLLYVFADQWRAHAVGFRHEDPVLTPNMDKFAGESMVFTNAISTYPLCSPHRASLLTGKYPYSCGLWTNCKIGLDEAVMLKPQEITISDVLKKEGYSTAYIGKWHLDASENLFYDNPESGAVNWDAYTPPGERRHSFDFWYSYGAMDEHLNPHYWMNSPDKIKPQKWSPENETDVAIEWLKNHDRQNPFCMFISWNPPHPPYDLVPDKYLELYRDKTFKFRNNVPESFQNDPGYLRTCREYYAAISGLDENFGRLLEALKNLGLEEDTIVVLSADHGDAMGSHGLMGKNIWYEESIQIPLIVHGNDIKAGTSDCLLASPDHMPTMLELVDAEIPSTVQGRSFAPVLMGKEMQNNPETAFLCMIPGMPELIEEYRKLGLNNKSFGWRGIKTKTHTYIIDNGTAPGTEQKRLLYDNVSDPYQLYPITLKKDDQVCKKYDLVLEDYLKLTKDPFMMNL